MVLHLKASDYMAPSVVMRTAIIPENAIDSISFYWESHNLADVFYMCFYFAEIQELSADQFREFSIFIKGESWSLPISLSYLSSTVVITNKLFTVTGHSKYVVTINKTSYSTIPPIINAAEVYAVKEFFHSETYDNDVSALLSIKSNCGLIRNWQGDPCLPMNLIWDGLSCGYVDFKSPRITLLAHLA